MTLDFEIIGKVATRRKELLLALAFICCAFPDHVSAQPTEQVPGASQRSGKSGSIPIVLRKVTFGKMHQYQSGYPGVKSLINASPDWVRRHISQELEDRVTSSTFSQTRNQEVLMVWFNRKNNRTAPAYPWDDLVHIVALDDHGCKFESYDVAYMGEGSHEVDVGTLEAFPRRQKTFKLQFVGDGSSSQSGEVIAQFEVTNPAYRDYPVWRPEARRQDSSL